jgi:hypothetical protein
MPTKVKIIGQKFEARPGQKPDGAKFGISVVEITDATSSFLNLPQETEGASVVITQGQTTPAFYLGGVGGDNRLSIDGATVGDEFVVMSTHNAFGGFTSEGE